MIDIYHSYDNRTAEELFDDPPSLFRGAPFWSWNNKLDRAQLIRQIGYFQDMGIGGFTIHCRTGLETPYLGEEYLRLVRDCVSEAKKRGMTAWLYDEDRWPSGFGGGMVTQETRFRARHLLFTPTPYTGKPGKPINISNAAGARLENGRLLARYDVVLERGRLLRYRRLASGQEAMNAEGTVWYAYLETAMPVPWFNDQTYVDTLNSQATKRFIEVTHETYLRAVGDQFGSVIPAIFTDEPQFPHKHSLRRAEERADLIIPFTDDLLETYFASYGQRLEDSLPEIFWERADGAPSATRWRYHDHVAERFASGYADVLGAWCRERGIALTGHLMEEPTLCSQTQALGEAMRGYRAFDLPGIDMLCDRHEYTTAKQAQSASRQFGRKGVLSELYGVTNWTFDFVGHKAQGDWQAALGVTVRVHHLSWVSMAGEAKRDYPASIFYQSPWHMEYSLIENHFARLASALTRGRPVVRVGMIHPIESYWLCFGPLEHTGAEREYREQTFREAVEWPMFELVDYDLISESLLTDLCEPDSAIAPLKVGQMAYDAIVVPPMRTIRSTTLDRLERFAQAGGRLIFAGEVPSLVDVVPSDRPRQLAMRAARIAWNRSQLAEAIDPVREVDVRLADGGRADSFLHQLRQEGDRRYLFLTNVDRVNPRHGTGIRVAGDWTVWHWDTMTGRRVRVESRRQNGATVVDWDFPAHGSALFMLEKGQKAGGESSKLKRRSQELFRLEDPVPVTLSEPNVLLLDQAEWQVDNGPWQAREEILRLDNRVRSHFGLPDRDGNIAQPWCRREPAQLLGEISMRFIIEVDCAVEDVLLALEPVDATRIVLDGRPIPCLTAGWWVDEAIKTVRLGQLPAGTRELIVTRPFTNRSELEWCYLLGDFGVRTAGRRARIVAPVRQLAFGDWTKQDLPFYAGNVTYHCNLPAPGKALELAVPHFRAPLLSIALDDRDVGRIAFAPFRLDLGTPSAGEHRLGITAFGNRNNAFGPIHLMLSPGREKNFWFGPDSWRTTGDDWANEYQLAPMGLLAAPQIYLIR